MSSSLFACSTKLPLASSKNQVSYFDGLEAGDAEVLADDITRAVKQGLSAVPGIYTQPING